MKQKLLFSCITTIVLILLIATYHIAKKQDMPYKPIEQTFDLPQILEKKELTILTLNSSTSFFYYRGEPMGFQYELAEMLCHSLGVQLKIQAVNNEEELVKKLLAGEGDLIAYNVAITKARKDILTFCGKDYITHQVIVQRNGKDVLKDVTQLINKDIYVLPGKYLTRLNNLNEELGGGINIHTVTADTVSGEDLITKVAEGKIDYTVATNELARLNRTYNPNLNVDLTISFDQKSAWAVRKSSPLLAKAINEWQDKYIDSPAVQSCVQRYFRKDKHTSHGSILSLEDGKISHYDNLFRTYSKEIGWDWRILASLAYTESNFDPTVVSWAGATGLMQLMPSTAHAYGLPVGMEQDPEESVKAAVHYIAELQKIFRKISDKQERIKFVLAAYNAGVGHVIDAMALADKYGSNKYHWDNQVEKYILLKSHEQYYQDPVCKNGYFRGQETYNFVRNVIKRAQIYQEKIKK